MDTFRAYLISRQDAQVRAAFTDMDRSQLDPGDVVVRIDYASINYKDALAATGKAPIIRRYPCVGGIDAAGTVESSNSPRFKPGDTVIVHSHGFGVSQHGGYAGLTRVPADWVNLVPPGLSALDAITIGVAGYTAGLAVELMEHNGLAPSRGKVVVNGASGGVASIAIDMLAQRGYEVVAATRKTNERDYLLGLGAAEVIDSASLSVGKRPLEAATWQGAVDSLGGQALADLIRTMQRDGVIASLGNAMGIEFTSTVLPFILRGVRLIGVNSDNEPPLRARLWERFATDLKPRHLAKIARVAPFEELPALIEEVAGGRIKGRTVIEMGARR
ncbi:acrylyl-CoA reductase family protein [Caenimonas soli]|uniref:acrylyl-CoA reductase family protein n=1 Tax=Caenimonas soli TaxID=2735555 RepID=UPI0015541102|nr:acryloyl-CoA reductase [Caenimonas soli]NPC54573.1 acryloyl-CoA reductase [Caenimonas soli]